MKGSLLLLGLGLAFPLQAFDLGYPQPVAEELRLPEPLGQPDPAQRYFLPGSDQPCKLPAFSSLLPNPQAGPIVELGKRVGEGGAGVLASFPDLMGLLESTDPDLNGLARSVFFALRDADERGRLFVGLDERNDWQREGLQGRPSRRLDYIDGSILPFSELRYDAQGYRISEVLYDSLQHASFTRLYERGPASCPSHIRVLDANGILKSEVRFSLDDTGRPLEERHLDSGGQPVLTRDYTWQQGRLVDFLEQKPGSFPFRLHFDYDAQGNLKARRGYGRKGSLQPIPYTEYLHDASGNTPERREWVENLGLRGSVPVSNGSADPRVALKYRWAYDLNADGSPDMARLYATLQNQSEFRTRRFRYSEAGQLRAVDESDRLGALLRMQAWEYGPGGALSLIQSGGSELPEANQSIDLSFDAQGNWVTRNRSGDAGPAKRVFEYWGQALAQ